MTETEREWLQLNQDLEGVCTRVLEGIDVQKSIPAEVAARNLRGFLLKSTRTLSAVNLLMSERLYEQSEALTRVLFELRVTFDCFCQMLASVGGEANKRILHAMMLEKFRQLQAADFFPAIEDVNRKDWEQAIDEIAAEYPPKELARMKRHGFTGLSMEQRARATGHLKAYNAVYRNFSRNIHSTDYVEHVGVGVLPEEGFSSYLHNRNIVIYHTAHVSAGGVAEAVNNAFGCGQESAIAALATRRAALQQAE